MLGTIEDMNLIFWLAVLGYNLAALYVVFGGHSPEWPRLFRYLYGAIVTLFWIEAVLATIEVGRWLL